MTCTCNPTPRGQTEAGPWGLLASLDEAAPRLLGMTSGKERLPHYGTFLVTHTHGRESQRRSRHGRGDKPQPDQVSVWKSGGTS